MERKGLTLETLFRTKYNLSQEVDIFALIQEAIMVTSWEKPEEFSMRKSNLAEILFRKPREPCRFEGVVEDDMGCDDNADGQDTRKNSLTTIRDALTTMENYCACSDNNGSKKGRRIIKLPKRRKEVVNDAKKKLDQEDMVQAKKCVSDVKKKLDQDMVKAKFEASVKKLESSYRQVQENKRKIQVLDVKDLPPPKSRCNNIVSRRRLCPNVSKQQCFRRPLCA